MSRSRLLSRVFANTRSGCHRNGLALRELLLTLALLTIGFGLVVSLTRRVRSEAAFSLARRELLELEDALSAYRRTFGRLPDVPPLVPRAAATASRAAVTLRPGDEPLLRERAATTIAATVRALGLGAGPSRDNLSPLAGLSAMEFDGTTLLDPWGRPIAYLKSGRAEIGIAAGDAPFFFSAGPDGLYLTREDNLYSYEVPTATGGAGGASDAVDNP